MISLSTARQDLSSWATGHKRDAYRAALDEIDRLNERVSDLEESLTIAYMLGGNAKEKEIDRLREALVDERANQIGWLTFDRGEMSWEEATREDARQQLEAEGKI